MDEDYYKPVRVKGAFGDNYIEYESRGEKNKSLSVREYLLMIETYLRDMINDHKAIGEWKIQLAIQTKFISSLDSGEIRVLHSWSDNIEIMMGSKTEYIINKLTDSLLEDYQEGIQSMNKSEFAFDSVDLLCYHLHKISLKRRKQYIKSPKWLENKRATINPKNDDDDDDDDDDDGDKCFQCAIAVALHYNKLKKKRSAKKIKYYSVSWERYWFFIAHRKPGKNWTKQWVSCS